MMWIGLVILILIVWFDARLLKAKSPVTFQEIFELSGGKKLILIGVILASSLTGAYAKDLFPALLAAVLMPMYWFRREAFLQDMQEWNPLSENSLADDPWSLKVEAMGVILGWIISGMVAAIAVRMFLGPGEKKSELIAILATMLISSAVVLFLISKALARRISSPFKVAVGLNKDGLSWVQLYLIPIFIALGCGFVAALVATGRVKPITPLSKIVDANSSSVALVSFLAVAVMLAPLIEEIVFRGYFFPLLEKLKGRSVALFVISGIFSLLHVQQYWGDVQAIGMVTVLGLLLTLMRARTGSTLPGVIMHYVYNFSVTVIPLILLVNANPAFFKYKANSSTYSETEKIGLLKTSLSVDPDLLEAINDLAWIYAGRGENLPEALRMIERAIKKEPDNHSFQDTKAEVLEKLEYFSEANKIRDQLISKGFMVERQQEKVKNNLLKKSTVVPSLPSKISKESLKYLSILTNLY